MAGGIVLVDPDTNQTTLLPTRWLTVGMQNREVTLSQLLREFSFKHTARHSYTLAATTRHEGFIDVLNKDAKIGIVQWEGMAVCPFGRKVARVCLLYLPRYVCMCTVV